MLVFTALYFTFKELYCHTVCLSLLQLEKLHISLWSQVSGLKNVAMFPVLYYENDCNAVWYKNFIKIPSLVYRLGYLKAI